MVYMENNNFGVFTMKYCSTCGNECHDAAIVCVKCGCAAGAVNYSQYPQQGQPAPAMGLSITAMVLGIVSLLFMALPIIGLPAAIVGLILAVIAKKQGAGGMATAGLVLSIIGVSLGALMVFAWIDASIRWGSYSSSWGSGDWW